MPQMRLKQQLEIIIVCCTLYIFIILHKMTLSLSRIHMWVCHPILLMWKKDHIVWLAMELSRRKLHKMRGMWQEIMLEGMSWGQKSRALWLREGDCNTKCFHEVANLHRKSNYSSSMVAVGINMMFSKIWSTLCLASTYLLINPRDLPWMATIVLFLGPW